MKTKIKNTFFFDLSIKEKREFKKKIKKIEQLRKEQIKYIEETIIKPIKKESEFIREIEISKYPINYLLKRQISLSERMKELFKENKRK